MRKFIRSDGNGIDEGIVIRQKDRSVVVDKTTQTYRWGYLYPQGTVHIDW